MNGGRAYSVGQGVCSSMKKNKTYYVEFVMMVIICFIGGVACYQLFDVEQATQLIGWVDARLLTLEKPNVFWSAVPIVSSIIIVLFFSTHPFFGIFAQLFIALKITFVGFSSVFLVAQHNSVMVYGLWWFPFQLIYCILLLVLYVNVRKGTGKKVVRNVFSVKQVFLILFVILAVFIGEVVAISYVFK